SRERQYRAQAEQQVQQVILLERPPESRRDDLRIRIHRALRHGSRQSGSHYAIVLSISILGSRVSAPRQPFCGRSPSGSAELERLRRGQAITEAPEKGNRMTRRTPVRTPDTPPGGVSRHRDRILNDKRPDPYQPRGKYHEPTVCADCRAVFRRGRWAHADAPEGARSDLCPACRRIREKLPAGSVTLEGAFYTAHR